MTLVEIINKKGDYLKIIGTSSYILVEFDNKTIKIQGEMMVGGFLAYSDSIKSWELPHDHKVIDELTKAKIINAVIEKTKKLNLSLSLSSLQRTLI